MWIKRILLIIAFCIVFVGCARQLKRFEVMPGEQVEITTPMINYIIIGVEKE